MEKPNIPHQCYILDMRGVCLKSSRGLWWQLVFQCAAADKWWDLLEAEF